MRAVSSPQVDRNEVTLAGSMTRLRCRALRIIEYR